MGDDIDLFQRVMKHMFETYQILPCKEVVFIKGEHEVALPIFRLCIEVVFVQGWSLKVTLSEVLP